MRNNMTSNKWLERDYSRYPEEIENINKRRIFTEVETKDGEIICTFRFGDEIYGTMLVLSFGTIEEAKEKYLNRGIDLAYELFKEELFKFELKFIKSDIQLLFDSLLKTSFKYNGSFIIDEVTYIPKISFFNSSYSISKWKKDDKGRIIEINTVDDIINKIKEDFYIPPKSSFGSNYRVKAAFCQLLDYLNLYNESE